MICVERNERKKEKILPLKCGDLSGKFDHD